MSRAVRNLQFGKQCIPYTLAFSARKQLKITVYPDGQVTVDAPQGRREEEVQHVLKKRVRWIAKQRDRFEKYQPLPMPRQFLSGETHRYLGKQYRLRVRQAATEKVAMSGGYINISVRQPHDTKRVRKLVEQWYRARAAEVFVVRLRVCQDRVKTHGIRPAQLKIRRMKTRWGSCDSHGVVTLNPELVRLPTPCIDYVIVHELCHLRIRTHTTGFYRLLEKCLPDWAGRRERLNMAATAG